MSISFIRRAHRLAWLISEDSGYEIETWRILKSRKLEYLIKACLQGGGDPR